MFMAGFEDLVDTYTIGCEDAYIMVWKDTCAKFIDVMTKLESKIEFSLEDVDEFQLLADEFCDITVI